MPSPEFVLLSRDRAERYEPQGLEVCISITDPGAPDVALSPRFAAVLRLQFSDIATAGGPTDVLFGPEHAARIVRFVAQWSGAQRIIVHCVGGASRSPAVALGLCDLNRWPPEGIEHSKPFWNSLVRSVLAESPPADAPARPDGPDVPRPANGSIAPEA